jgi:uncharacterized protein (DUF433 family)
MSTVTYSHVELRHGGKPYIAGTGFKVRGLVEEFLATGSDPHELQRSHPELTLGQIYSALAYYYDHKDEIDGEIAGLRAFAEEYRAELGEPRLAQKLREMGKELP